MRARSLGVSSLLFLAANAAVAASPFGPVGQVPTMGLSALHGIRFDSIQFNPTIHAFPLQSPPIGGFKPQFVFGLTDEQDPDDISFATHASSSPGGVTLPVGGPARYFVATFDTGSQAHLVSYDDAQFFNLSAAGRAGSYQAQILGVNGIEEADISDGLGVYFTGIAGATVNGGQVNPASALRGQWNCSILTAQEDSFLPNLLGSPLMAQYQVVINNTNTHRLQVGSTTYRSPQLSIQALNTAVPVNYYKLTLSIQSANGLSPDPVFFPSLDNFNNWADDPVTPSFWASPFALANAGHTAGTSGAQDFLFDTGAEVTVLSEDTAASVGYYTGGPNPSTPDFYVDVMGVGGQITQVPGFYMQSLSVTTNGGPVTWTNVPVLVLNIADPRDNVGFVPGILGTNLFTDRDLVINGGLGNPFVAFSGVITPEWGVNASGAWGEDGKWILGVPDAPDAAANFLSKINAPQTITVDGPGYTFGSMKFDNASQYTINGTGLLTAEVSAGSVNISVVNGSHSINAPMVLESNTLVTVIQSGSTLTMSNDVDGGTATLTKTGAGTLVMKNVRAEGLSINNGVVRINSNGTSVGASRVQSLAIAGGAKMDLTDNDLVIDYTGSSPLTTITGLISSGYAAGAWTGNGLTSSSAEVAASTSLKTALGFAEATDLFTSFPATFAGQSVDATSILIRYTAAGDATLDGSVNGADFNVLASHFGGSGKRWSLGDFTYDGVVNGADFNLLAGNFGKTVPSGPGAAVPEPAGLAIVLAAGIFLRRRRA